MYGRNSIESSCHYPDFKLLWPDEDLHLIGHRLIRYHYESYPVLPLFQRHFNVYLFRHRPVLITPSAEIAHLSPFKVGGRERLS